MSFETVLPIWESIQQRFYKLVKAIPENDLTLRLDSVSIISLVRHTAEAEFIFMEWFFGKSIPEGMKERMSGKPDPANTGKECLEELLELLNASNHNVIEAMRSLPQESWHKLVESPMGTSTPLEAIGRLMYHTGIHAGQISLIQKTAKSAHQ